MRRLAAVGIGLATMLAASSADAQLRRRPAPPGEPQDPTGPTFPKRPYDGTWEGWFVLRSGPGADERHPIHVAFAAAGDAAGPHAGARLEADGSRSSAFETVERDGTLQWRLPNSGGGVWEYSARLVARDSIAGTLRLRDWPQLPAGERAPSGTFVLVRRAGGPAGGR